MLYLVILDDNHIGILYERDNYNKIVFEIIPKNNKSYNIKWLYSDLYEENWIEFTDKESRFIEDMYKCRLSNDEYYIKLDNDYYKILFEKMIIRKCKTLNDIVYGLETDVMKMAIKKMKRFYIL